MIRKFYVDDLFDSKFMEENNDVTVVKAREILKLVTDYNTEITKEIEFEMLSIVVYDKTFNIRNDVNNGKLILNDDDNIFNIKKLKIISGDMLEDVELFKAAIEDMDEILVAYFDNVDKYKLSFRLGDTVISLHIKF